MAFINFTVNANKYENAADVRSILMALLPTEANAEIFENEVSYDAYIGPYSTIRFANILNAIVPFIESGEATYHSMDSDDEHIKYVYDAKKKTWKAYVGNIVYKRREMFTEEERGHILNALVEFERNNNGEETKGIPLHLIMEFSKMI